MIAGLSRTRRLEFRDGWARVKRLGFALAALVAVGVPGAAAAAAHTIALFPAHPDRLPRGEEKKRNCQ